MGEPKTLGDQLPKEIARVRDELMPMYREIGPAGGIALAMMQNALDRASRAMIEGDLVGMIASYKELKDFNA